MTETISKTVKRLRKAPGERRNEILRTLAVLLESPKQNHITTKLLAAEMGISEAALYRHFASKAQMFESLIGFVEHSVLTLINAVGESQPAGLLQAEEIALTLLEMIRSKPGMVRLLVGDALTNEDSRLQARINLFFDKLETSIKQSLRFALMQNEVDSNYEINERANLLVSLILGHWHRFAKQNNSDKIVNAVAQVHLILRSRLDK